MKYLPQIEHQGRVVKVVKDGKIIRVHCFNDEEDAEEAAYFLRITVLEVATAATLYFTELLKGEFNVSA